jgi:hypothetical protein
MFKRILVATQKRLRGLVDHREVLRVLPGEPGM